jgi:hypothetical protein
LCGIIIGKGGQGLERWQNLDSIRKGHPRLTTLFLVASSIGAISFYVSERQLTFSFNPTLSPRFEEKVEMSELKVTSP